MSTVLSARLPAARTTFGKPIRHNQSKSRLIVSEECEAAEQQQLQVEYYLAGRVSLVFNGVGQITVEQIGRHAKQDAKEGEQNYGGGHVPGGILRPQP